MEQSYKAIQEENYQLRDYIINLQSRLIESQGEYPQPPSNIDLPHPRQDGAMQVQMTGPATTVPTAPMGGAASVTAATPDNQLQASAAQAVAASAVGGDSKTQVENDAAAAAAQLVGNANSNNNTGASTTNGNVANGMMRQGGTGASTNVRMG